MEEKEVSAKILERRRLFGERWIELSVEFHPGLLQAARSLNKSDVFTAEDWVDATFEKMFYYAPDPDGIKNMMAFLKKTMKNIDLSKWKKEKTDRMVSLEEPLGENSVLGDSISDGSLDALTRLENEEMIGKMRKELNYLTPRERILLIFHLTDYSNEEIAERLGEDKDTISHDLNTIRTKFIAKCRRSFKIVIVNARKTDVARTSF